MQMIINGQKVDASNGAVIDVFNPVTHEKIDTVPCATKEDVERCIQVAVKGKDIWSAYPVDKRAEILVNVAKLMEEEADAIATLLSKENGKPYAQALGEVKGSEALFVGYAGKIRHYYGATLPKLGKDMFQVVKEPLGVVACINPFNFPVNLYAHKAAPTLAAGNALIIKPATDTPLTSIYMTDLLIRAGVPAEACQIITGRGSEIGDWLSTSPYVDAINMTGSTEVGVEIAQKAANHLAHVFLELGGNDPLIVLDDGDIDLAVEETVANRILCSGQTCCAPKRFIVHNSVIDEYTQKVVERFNQIVMGDPFDPKTELGPVISEKAAQKMDEQIRATGAQGAKEACGGEIVDKTFYKPTVLTDVTKDMDIAKDMEVFGPIVPIIGFDTDEEAIAIANQSIYGLSGGVISRDWRRAANVADKVDSGLVVINGSGLYRNDDMPFNGHKMSGTGGGEGFFNTLDELHRTKVIAWKNLYD